jgi:hypothetical protein
MATIATTITVATQVFRIHEVLCGRFGDVFGDGLLKRDGVEIATHSYSFDRYLITQSDYGRGIGGELTESF